MEGRKEASPSEPLLDFCVALDVRLTTKISQRLNNILLASPTGHVHLCWWQCLRGSVEGRQKARSSESPFFVLGLQKINVHLHDGTHIVLFTLQGKQTFRCGNTSYVGQWKNGKQHGKVSPPRTRLVDFKNRSFRKQARISFSLHGIYKTIRI